MRSMAPSLRAARWCPLVLASVFALVLAAPAQAGRIVDWQADGAGDKPQGWVLEKFGNVREAQMRMGRDARGAAAQLRFASGDANRPTASARFPVPFAPLHVYRVTMELSAPAPVQAEVVVRRRAAPYDPMAVRAVSLDDRWQTVALEATWPAGAADGDVRVQLRDAEGNVSVRRLSVDDQGPAPLGTPPNKPFPATLIGVHVNKFGQHTTWPAAGQGLVRLWDTGTTWSHLAPTLEQFDGFNSDGWKRLDALVDYVRKNRPDATLLYTLGMPPAWASSQPDLQCPYAKGACAAPASIDAWRHYVRTLAQRYQGRIRYWELWNEADYRMFYSGAMPMVELAKVASEELKAVDPQNRLLSPGYTNSTGLNALYGFLRDGGARYVDIIGYHWYFNDRPEQLVGPIRNVRRVMDEAGAAGKPIWNTEGAALCTGKRDGGRGCAIADLAAGDVDAVAARAILTMWLNGVEAFAYYTAEGAGGRTPALLSDDYKSSTPAAAALRQLAGWMVGARAVAVSSWGRAGHTIECERDGKRFAIVWSELDNETLAAPAGWGAAERLDGGAASSGGGALSVGRVPLRVPIGARS